MNQLISIVVACYNQQDYIIECLNSIFNQSYSNLELIVINDGSTDGSQESIEKLLEQCPFAENKLLNQENQGIVFVRNRGIEESNGEFIIFVDGDDKLPANYVEEVIKVAIEKCADIVYTSIKNLETGEVFLDVGEFNRDELIKGNFVHASSLIRKSAITSIRFDRHLNRERLEDYDFFLNLLLSNNVVFYPCYNTSLEYRVSDSSRSNHNDLDDYYRAYSYVFSKHTSKYPSLSKNILDFHFNRLIKLDIEHSLKRESFQVFNFINDDLLHSTAIKKENCFTLDTKKVDKIKVRPTNIPSFYQKISVVDVETDQDLSPILSNGLLVNTNAIFHDFYPFIDYDVKNISQVKISYKRFNISDITAEDYIAKILGNELYFSNEELHVMRNNLNSEINILNEKFKELQIQYNNLNENYQSVINSRRWRILTKIINIFRRK